MRQWKPQSWTRLALVFVALALAPALEDLARGPGALAIEADHQAFHAEQGHGHDSPDGHHDSADHDHVMTAILADPPSRLFPLPAPRVLPGTASAGAAIRGGPKRPPRFALAARRRRHPA